jgi:hypothetical protein
MLKKLRLFDSSTNSSPYREFVREVIKKESQIALLVDNGPVIDVMLHGSLEDGLIGDEETRHILIVQEYDLSVELPLNIFFVKDGDAAGFRELLQVFYKQPWRNNR